MALIIPYRFIESEHMSSLEITIQDDIMTGFFRPPGQASGTSSRLDAAGLTEGISELRGNVVRENEDFIIVQGRWRNMDGDEAEGNFEMNIDAKGNSGQGWWEEDGFAYRHDWVWSTALNRVQGSRSVSVGGIQEPLLHETPEESRSLKRCGTTQRRFNRSGSVARKARVGTGVVRSRRGSTEEIEIETLDPSKCCFSCTKFATSIWLIRYSLFCADLFLLAGFIQLISHYIDHDMFTDMGPIFNAFYSCVSGSYLFAYMVIPKQPNWIYVIMLVLYGTCLSAYVTYIDLGQMSLAVQASALTFLSIGFIAFNIYVWYIDPTNAVYVSGVAQYHLGYIAYFLRYYTNFNAMNIFGSALSMTGSVPLVVATVPITFSCAISSPFNHSASLFWGGVAFTIGSMIFLLDSMFLTLPMGYTHDDSKWMLIAGTFLFCVGRTYNIWAVTSLDCDFFFRRHQPKRHRIYKRERKPTVQMDDNVVFLGNYVAEALQRYSEEEEAAGNPTVVNQSTINNLHQ